VSALPFPSGVAVDTSALPRVSSGRTTLADGSDGALLQADYTQPLRPRFPALPTSRLRVLAEELGVMVALEGPLDEPWARWAANVERQAIAELARRAI
jgi:hypothetical protein